MNTHDAITLALSYVVKELRPLQDRIVVLSPESAKIYEDSPVYKDLMRKKEELENLLEKDPFKQAIYHLRAVCGSRNSFTPEANDRLFDMMLPSVSLRSEAVQEMHQAANEFLKLHDK